VGGPERGSPEQETATEKKKKNRRALKQGEWMGGVRKERKPTGRRAKGGKIATKAPGRKRPKET